MTDITARERALAALQRLAEVERPEVWISLAEPSELIAQAEDIDRRTAAGDDLPLAGTVIAVKDNIDVAGFDTTAGSPGSRYRPERDAEAVRLLRAAGALVLGKTNMDQFATGLVGTRSPYGAVRAARDPELVSGGSSAGSAVAVALGIVDAALGTDTAGSGRVPAAFNGIVGVKPTLGLVSTRGVVPAAPSYDAVTVFARELPMAQRCLAAMIAVDELDPGSRAWSPTAPLAAAGTPVIGIPTESELGPMTAAWRATYRATVEYARLQGFDVVEVSIASLLEAARLLYEGALVAERTAAFGHLLDLEPDTVDATVAGIVRSGSAPSAVQLVQDQQRLRAERSHLRALWRRVDALLLPTAPGHPTIDEVRAQPVARNAWVGTYTNFVNLLDLSAIAIPGVDPVGVTLIGPAHADRALLDLAARVLGQPSSTEWMPEATPIAVFGAHMTGESLNGQLTARGARLRGAISTAPEYRLFALETTPPKPGLLHVGEVPGATSVTGEEWLIPPGRLAEFLSDLVAPMTIGRVTLADGRRILGFLCEPAALDDATDITVHGDWRRFLATEVLT
ncbi:allophanate hydrolase [Promicromonospora sp. MEB111]|uniref:allophanate hydrolase n=1 Tax=Promicromonospora sp. MEB111 TaxID=3040301 RepID=UPI002550ABDF|nr:allophanate hydrolase [Promicromonospora sp. MEB111]